MGIPLAHRFLLNDTPFNPDETDAPTARRYNAAIISNGKDDKFVATPSGLSIEMMSKLGGMTEISTEVSNNPKIELAKGAIAPNVDTLSTIAAKDNHGNVVLLVVNQSSTNDVTTKIAFDKYTHAKKAKISTMNGSSIYSMNTLDQPNNVTINSTDFYVGKGDFNYTFPAHSITRIELK
jgi:alpha-N-arabinofuranosidase